jgi:hypothetical protein
MVCSTCVCSAVEWLTEDDVRIGFVLAKVASRMNHCCTSLMSSLMLPYWPIHLNSCKPLMTVVLAIASLRCRHFQRLFTLLYLLCACSYIADTAATGEMTSLREYSAYSTPTTNAGVWAREGRPLDVAAASKVQERQEKQDQTARM